MSSLVTVSSLPHTVVWGGVNRDEEKQKWVIVIKTEQCSCVYHTCLKQYSNFPLVT